MIARSRLAVLVLSLGAAAGSAEAATWTVDPVAGPNTDLQDVIDHAAPGDVVIVKGGTWVAIELRKPITLVAEPRATIRAPHLHEAKPWGGFGQAPALYLKGPGHGRASLVNFDVVGDLEDVFWFGLWQSPVHGKGFDRLSLERCSVRSPTWSFPDGLAYGRPAIDVTVAEVHLCECLVVAADNANDVNCMPMPDGPPGVRAPNATVVILDSEVKGGAGFHEAFCYDVFCGTQPPAQGCPCPVIGGRGGPAVLAQSVLHANSELIGGAGMAVFSKCGSGGTYLGRQENGPAVLAQIATDLGRALRAPLPPQLGQGFTLAWQVSAPALLLVEASPLEPELVPHEGWFFLPGDQPFLLVPIPAGSTSLSAPLPPHPALVGLSLSAQIHAPGAGFTRPVTGTILP